MFPIFKVWHDGDPEDVRNVLINPAQVQRCFGEYRASPESDRLLGVTIEFSNGKDVFVPYVSLEDVAARLAGLEAVK